LEAIIPEPPEVEKLRKRFNTTGICLPENHYMVNMQEKIQQIIKEYVERGEYFTINRARQYGKTTTLSLLEKSLSEKYTVFSITFEGTGDSAFGNENTFCRFICRLLYNAMQYGEVCKIP